MKLDEIVKIQSELNKNLKPERYEHTLAVAFTAVSLAMCYGYDTEKSFTAGLLHDCAKGMKDSELLAFCEDHKLSVSSIERENTALLHSKVGSILAKEKYEIDDKEIMDAIRYHTTGHPEMTVLEKIIFISDYIEPFRKHDCQLKEIRVTAYKNLDLCLQWILKNTIRYLKTSGKVIDTMTELTYEYYKKEE